MFGDFKSSFKGHGPFLLPAADLLYLINFWNGKTVQNR